jgi:hypothetical protein
VLLFAISLLNGFLIHALPLPRLALSAHLVALIGSSFLIGLGASWPRLQYSARASRLAAFLAVYGFCGAWVVYFSSAALAAGGQFTLASGNVRGPWVVESAISVGLMTVAVALIALCGMTWRALGRPHVRI